MFAVFRCYDLCLTLALLSFRVLLILSLLGTYYLLQYTYAATGGSVCLRFVSSVVHPSAVSPKRLSDEPRDVVNDRPKVRRASVPCMMITVGRGACDHADILY